MGFFSALLPAVGKALGGAVVNKAFGGDKDRQTTTRVNYAQLRNDAQAAGFNPLTALKATGGMGNTTTTEPPALSSRQFIANALNEGLDNWFNRDQIALDKERQRLEVDIARAELDNLRKAQDPATKRFGYDLHRTITDRQEQGPPDMRIDKMPRRLVFLPDGQIAKVPANWAERMGINEGDWVSPGDYAELLGELRGEGEVALASGAIAKVAGVPFFGTGIEAPSEGGPRKPKTTAKDIKDRYKATLFNGIQLRRK